jgi:exopolyphosphatase/guanosine-5'-triphosphate,3'-diphosphate pyrophosphatase
MNTTRVAAVDVGSNAIRYVVAEVAGGVYTEIESERIAVRLGTDVFTRTRRFRPETVDTAVAALVRIRRRLDDLGISHYRAVATSAVRESRNGGELVDRIRRESGIHLETISGSEEARLVWIAVTNRVDFADERWLMMDLGGGSVEISVADRGGILWSESHTLGSVRMLQTFQEEGVSPSGAAYQDLLERYTHVLKVPRAVGEYRPSGTIATGGNIEALADLAGASKDDRGVSRLPVATLRALIEKLGAMTTDERVKELGLREDRADVILPASVVYERVADLAGAEEIVVPRTGVKEGLVLDLLDRITDEAAHSDRHEHTIHAAALTLGRRFQFDENHGQQVARLSLLLFDQLRELHGLGNRERNILMAGALLHDIGQYVSYQRHHKHSMYLIANSELPGMSPEDLRMVAALARYHRRSEPKLSHSEFEAMSVQDREAICKLAALLRVADALDREHIDRVATLSARWEDVGLVLELETRGSLTLEEWALRRKGKMFKSVYGRPVRLESVLIEA